MSSVKNYLVSALVTTYNSERYMRGLLEDLEAQTIADQLEIVIVDSNSPQNEGAIIGEYQKRYDNIVYLRTEDRESSHAAWNRCIHLARGKYLTIACTDDRHRPDALELMVRVLEEYPEYGLVYADSLITTVENETFEQNSATKRYDWPDYNLGTALSSCIFGPQPVWRRDVHEKAGYFNPSIWIAGDHDLFIRIAWRCGAVHLRETLGLFLKRDDSNSGRNNREEAIRDALQVLRFYREQIPIADIYSELQSNQDDPCAMAAALWHFGNLCALSPYNDFELAMKQYQLVFKLKGLPSEYVQKLKIMF
ncbi:MAG: glycosyltransferase family 2 protein, partial [bacterium]